MLRVKFGKAEKVFKVENERLQHQKKKKVDY
jgi:hypothetical protein